MGKWIAFLTLSASLFLYDPPWAMQHIDHFARVVGLR
jgi:hypothetical protein